MNDSPRPAGKSTPSPAPSASEVADETPTAVQATGDAPTTARATDDTPTTVQPAAGNPGDPTPAADDPTSGDSAGSSATKRLLRALAVMGSGTMVSRVLGLVRVALAAFVIGNGTAQADMYAVAITVPTALYILFAGGALNSVLVPQLARAAKHDEDGGEAYTNRITTAFLLILLTVTVIVTAAAPLITWIYSSDRWRTPEMADHYQAMVFLTMVCLPEVFFYGAFVVLGQILNARDRFGPMMWAPVASNIIQVLSFVVFLSLWGRSDGQAPFSSTQIWVLGGGYLLGSILQAGAMVFFLRRVGYRFRPRFDLKGTGLSKTFKLAGWAVGFVLVNQVALAVVSRLATSATAGGSGAGLTVYNNAYLVFLLPHSLITVSLATAMVSSASRLAAAGDLAGTAAEVMRTMRLVAAALVPAALLLVALGPPIAMLLFGNGTGAQDAPFIGWTIMAFAVGLVAFTLQHVCLRTYYALEKNRDTFFIQLIIASLQIGLSLLFVLPFDRDDLVAPMLGLALSGAYAVGLLISFRHLQRFLPALSGRELLLHVGRVLLVSLPGAAIALVLTQLLEGSRLMLLLSLALGGLVAIGAYVLAARAVGLAEIAPVLDRFSRGRATTKKTPKAATKAAPKKKDAKLDEAAISTQAQALGNDPLAEELLPPTEARPAADRSDAGEEEPTDPVAAGGSRAPVDPDAPTTAMSTRSGSSDADGEDSGEEDTDEIVDSAPSGESDRTDDRDDEHDTAEELHPIRVRPGRVLGQRYQLDEVLVRRAETQTWKATDQVLSRQVLIHLLPAGGDSERFLTPARRAAVATDSRFVRILDAQIGEEPTSDADADSGETDSPVGPYIVCEYAPGMSLERLLAAGPLSALESAWVVREVADGLAGMHDQGLYHERINPDTVVITATGNVKIVGFQLESELSPAQEHPLTGSSDPEAMDVADLGRLLYCTLVSRWPGGHGYGMAAAPLDSEGHLLTPRQVRAGVSPALDSICDRILSPVPRQGEARLRSAHEVVRALNQVLGTANAAQDLERRLRYPVPVVSLEDEADTPTTQHSVDDIDTAAALPVAPLADPEAQTGRIALPAVAGATGAMSPMSQATPSEPMVRERRIVQTYVGDERDTTGDPPRRWVVGLIMLTVAVLVGSLIAVALRLSPDTRQESVSPSQWPIVAADDFDPQPPGNGEENPGLVPLAHDGDPGTAWQTVDYAQADMTNKDGVGIVFDLGEVRSVARARLTLVGAGTSVELRIPAQEADNIVAAPMERVNQWERIAGAELAPEEVVLTADRPVQTRFVLVLLTELPEVGVNYRGGIAEAVFEG
ncbi:MAG: murein biosynthesis integral membrane protein MurJ [Propionibacteriaceae bacterium]|nr:murein biosynthesis integral membrane protein MurJ [Propionibacteriaceae bacterium]